MGTLILLLEYLHCLSSIFILFFSYHSNFEASLRARRKSLKHRWNMAIGIAWFMHDLSPYAFVAEIGVRLQSIVLRCVCVCVCLIRAMNLLRWSNCGDMASLWGWNTSPHNVNKSFFRVKTLFKFRLRIGLGKGDGNVSCG